MNSDATRSKSYRYITAAFGVLFTVIAIAIIVVSDRSTGPLLAAIVVGLLGVDGIASAWRNKSSLLSRIGPLP